MLPGAHQVGESQIYHFDVLVLDGLENALSVSAIQEHRQISSLPLITHLNYPAMEPRRVSSVRILLRNRASRLPRDGQLRIMTLVCRSSIQFSCGLRVRGDRSTPRAPRWGEKQKDRA